MQSGGLKWVFSCADHWTSTQNPIGRDAPVFLTGSYMTSLSPVGGRKVVFFWRGGWCWKLLIRGEIFTFCQQKVSILRIPLYSNNFPVLLYKRASPLCLTRPACGTTVACPEPHSLLLLKKPILLAILVFRLKNRWSRSCRPVYPLYHTGQPGSPL